MSLWTLCEMGLSNGLALVCDQLKFLSISSLILWLHGDDTVIFNLMRNFQTHVKNRYLEHFAICWHKSMSTLTRVLRLVAWWHQAINWCPEPMLTSHQWCSVAYIRRSVISHQACKLLFSMMSLKIILLKFLPHLPGTDESIFKFQRAYLATQYMKMWFRCLHDGSMMYTCQLYQLPVETRTVSI